MPSCRLMKAIRNKKLANPERLVPSNTWRVACPMNCPILTGPPKASKEAWKVTNRPRNTKVVAVRSNSRRLPNTVASTGPYCSLMNG